MGVESRYGNECRLLPDSLRSRGRDAQSGTDGSSPEADRSVSRTKAQPITDAVTASSISIAAESTAGAGGPLKMQ